MLDPYSKIAAFCDIGNIPHMLTAICNFTAKWYTIYSKINAKLIITVPWSLGVWRPSQIARPPVAGFEYGCMNVSILLRNTLYRLENELGPVPSINLDCSELVKLWSRDAKAQLPGHNPCAPSRVQRYGFWDGLNEVPWRQEQAHVEKSEMSPRPSRSVRFEKVTQVMLYSVQQREQSSSQFAGTPQVCHLFAQYLTRFITIRILVVVVEYELG